MASFKIEGAAELRRALEALGPEIATKVGQAANNRAGRLGAAAVT